MTTATRRRVLWSVATVLAVVAAVTAVLLGTLNPREDSESTAVPAPENNPFTNAATPSLAPTPSASPSASASPSGSTTKAAPEPTKKAQQVPAPAVRGGGGFARYDDCPTATVTVANRAQLLSAIAGARPGSVIRLQPGTYPGRYEGSLRGTSAAPIWLCGPRSAVIDGGGIGASSGLRLTSSTNAVIAGFTVRNSQKGVMVSASRQVTVADMRVEDIGNEAIHLNLSTTDSAVVGNSIARTGLQVAMYGEGVYVGNSALNWCKFNGCKTDASSRNTIAYNVIRQTKAQAIDIKAGAENGLIVGNDLDGTGMVEGKATISIIELQTTGWTVRNNRMVNAPKDGVTVWEYSWKGDRWGGDNRVVANKFGGSIPGVAVRLAFRDIGNVAGCSNTVPAGATLSNKPCTKSV